MKVQRGHTVKVLDLAGSDYDGANVINIAVKIPIKHLQSRVVVQPIISVANNATRALRVDSGDLITEFVDSNYRNNPVVLKAFSGVTATTEKDGVIPNLLSSLRNTKGGMKVTSENSRPFSGPNNGLKNRGGVTEADYFVELDLPVVMDSSGTAAQLYYLNEVPSGGFPSGTYTFETEDGFNQALGYKQSYDLADYYVAYNPGENSSLVYTAIEYAPDGQESATYNNLTANPIEARKSWDNLTDKPADQKTPSAIGVQPGLRFGLRAYGDIAYQLSITEQQEIEDSQSALIDDLTSLANKIKKSYLTNPVLRMIRFLREKVREMQSFSIELLLVRCFKWRH